MKYPNRKAELIIGLVALLVIIAALALSMFFTWYAEHQNTPVKESTQTWSYDHAISDNLVGRLILEEGPGYKRMQFFYRVTMGLTQESESIYAEVKE